MHQIVEPRRDVLDTRKATVFGMKAQPLAYDASIQCMLPDAPFSQSSLPHPAVRPVTLSSLPRSHAELLELQLVLETGAQFFDDAAQSASAAHSERADDAGAWPLGIFQIKRGIRQAPQAATDVLFAFLYATGHDRPGNPEHSIEPWQVSESRSVCDHQLLSTCFARLPAQCQASRSTRRCCRRSRWPSRRACAWAS